MTFGGKVCLFKLQKGSKIDLLSKIWIFLENRQKKIFFKKSEKNLVTSKMEQNPSSCSIGIWNYHLAPSKLKPRIFLCPYASPLWFITIRIRIFGLPRTVHAVTRGQITLVSVLCHQGISFWIWIEVIIFCYKGQNLISNFSTMIRT